jgi:murein DD-endopeptidase MepM/ murein hydrolase activator NlpD
VAVKHTLDPEPEQETSTLARWWSAITAFGWREAALRYASHGLMLALVGAVIWLQRFSLGIVEGIAAKTQLEITVPAAVAPTPTAPADSQVTPAALATLPALRDDGRITRSVDVHTVIPTRGRSAVITYTVAKGDTLFGIAQNYGLKPETVLWGNYFVLKDDPHLLFPGQVLSLLPVDGTYHYVTAGNTVEQIAKFYGVQPQDIVDWPGNNLDPANPVPTPDTWLVVPGGHRELQSWQLPTIARSTRTTQANNFGQCPGGYTGAIGDGVFVWPADNHTLSGYDYSGIHHGIDIRAGLGAPIYAADNGVVVYAGPNDYGYGNVIMLDHGNGWLSVYAHLSQWNVVCGQSVFRGNLIGLAGNTGRSSGAHLHFEVRYNGAYVNPWDVLPP